MGPRPRRHARGYVEVLVFAIVVLLITRVEAWVFVLALGLVLVFRLDEHSDSEELKIPSACRGSTSSSGSSRRPPLGDT